MYFATSAIEVSPLVPPTVAFVVSFCTSLAGVSGAVLLVPFQVSVLGITSPSVSATNLVFNLVATPSGIWQFARERRLDWRLAAVMVTGTVPGLLAGWWLRSRWLLDPHRFNLFAGCVLLLLALRMLAAVPSAHRVVEPRSLDRRGTTASVLGLALVVGVIGGAYGIGGGAIMAPVLVAYAGIPVHAVAGATLSATFLTSAAGVAMYSLLPAPPGVSTAPDWPLGLLFGLGGAAGMYAGALTQKRIPERLLRAGLAAVISALGVTYILQFLLAGAVR